jgi:hypothetical protein
LGPLSLRARTDEGRASRRRRIPRWPRTGRRRNQG